MSRKQMSFKDAAKRVLEKSREPMSAKEITATALEAGLLETAGKTPDATMAAQLYVDIRDNPKSPFMKAGRGRFGLKKEIASASSPDVIIRAQNDLVRASLKKQLLTMDPYQFEFLVADLLQKIGYEDVQVTKRSGDKGVDIVADLTLDGVTNVKTVIQAKRYAEGNRVPGATVTQLRGSAEVDQRGLIITTSDFTKDARAEARAPNKMPVALINGDKLVSLLIQHEVAVTKETVALYSVDTDYFENVVPETALLGDQGKNRTLWPLPGGTTAYVDTLLQFLDAVEAGVNTPAKAVGWFLETFDTVNSENSANGYANVPRSIGLSTVAGDRYTLTEAGRRLQAERDLSFLYDTLLTNVLGVEEIVEFLESSGGPQDEEAILDFLTENLGVAWKTYAQVNYRLQWLMNLGRVQKVEGGWVAS